MQFSKIHVQKFFLIKLAVSYTDPVKKIPNRCSKLISIAK